MQICKGDALDVGGGGLEEEAGELCQEEPLLLGEECQLEDQTKTCLIHFY